MLKRILIGLGLAKAPAPIRTYFAVSSFFGGIPALAYVAWKNRRQIKSLVDRVTHKQSKQLAAPAI